jgi:dCMP deaminase
MLNRPDWDTYFLSIAKVVASRSTCMRRKVGAVLVKDRQILSTGYNGAPKGITHCEEAGCLREELGIPSGERHEICRGSHAEINAIAQAAYAGVSTAGCWLYCTHEPCVYCTKALLNCGCSRIVFINSYPDQIAREIISQSGVEILCIPEDKLIIETTPIFPIGGEI